MKKVTGIGGFFRQKMPSRWQRGMITILAFRLENICMLVTNRQLKPIFLLPATQSFHSSKKSDYFAPSRSRFMINFRVKDLNALLNDLKSEGHWVDDKVEEYECGKFGWTMDPEGNKIELWEPVDEKL